tara:strand:- start:1296 stop:1556 length:261 start_codon:yes stop_codon:yes gene_type:complete
MKKQVSEKRFITTDLELKVYLHSIGLPMLLKGQLKNLKNKCNTAPVSDSAYLSNENNNDSAWISYITNLDGKHCAWSVRVTKYVNI